MKRIVFARSLASGILGVILFLFLVAVGINVCDDRCSRNLDVDEISPEDGFQQETPLRKERSNALVRDRDGVGSPDLADHTLFWGGDR